MTYTVTSFGKAFAHVRNCLLKKAHVINKNIGIKHRILATFNIEKKINMSNYMPLTRIFKQNNFTKKGDLCP
jgi:hypothetical protein